jgi:hypothetical protein
VIRHSQSTEKNPQVEDWTGEYKERSNPEFFTAAFERFAGRSGRMAIGLLGQRDLPGAVLRRAQAILRWDLRPSLWSHAFLIASDPSSGPDIGDTQLREVTMHSRGGTFPEPAANAVTDARLADYRDARVDANAALLVVDMSEDDVKAVAHRAIDDVNLDRVRYDLWQALGVWQTFLWSAGAAPNPLREGFPVFSSSFVEYCYEGIGLDLSPGASERNSAPEHLWNAALWWHETLGELDHGISGCCVLRDPYATVLDPGELG